ncbi:tyrosine-protein kinase Btk isoform X3 [Cloeon dipterum]|uniref:tyrosine-protein kinase Btk isoform X3 n=1 Tax=Cloeon dipterum TaxID=197152 RepID=UPI0032204D03
MVVVSAWWTRRRERGRIELSRVSVVETAQLAGDGEPPPPVGFAFQVGYAEGGQSFTLHLLASKEQDRADWIRSIRAVCADNINLSERFHVGVWNGRRWSCCRVPTRSAEGCDSSSWTPRNQQSNRSTNSNQQTQLSVISAPTTVAEPEQTPSTRLGAPSTPIMPGGAPGTPSSKAKEKLMIRPKIVVALYPFRAIEGDDLSLERGAEYEVLDDSQEHWWKVKNDQGAIGYIPSNYVKEKELLGLQRYEWYVGDMSRQRAESLLKQEDKEGCFVVRNSSTKGLYTLSLYTKVPHPHVKHYHIKQNIKGEFFLSEKHCCNSIPELVNYHKHNGGGLASRLKASPCNRPVPATAGLSHDKWEIDPMELMLLEELGSGQFGVVRRGKWRGSIDVAVKMMKEGTMSEDDFIDEAKVMTKLQHQNLVQLYGVCSKHRPIYIVTEYMKHGSLLNYLRRHEQTLGGNVGLLLDMCIQVCKGMAYLERHNYIHRDLAARNCLVGSENVVKVADFGLARYVLDDQYTSSGGTKFPIKWAPPEVLNYTRFSSKSDIWAYGVLMWEVFTCGKMPYGRLKNTEVVDRVQRGILLEKPKACFKEVYDVMRKCWSHSPEDRPSFRVLKEQLVNVSKGLLAD